MNTEEEFWSFVEITDGCWNWIGKTNKNGYGYVWFATHNLVFPGNFGTKLVHRVSYELYFGLVPNGLTLDHLCLNKACVNPSHLEPVSIQENTLRWRKVFPEKVKENARARAELRRLRPRKPKNIQEKKPKKTWQERFWAKVVRHSDEGCWIWIGAVSKSGGRFASKDGGEQKLAHRLSYETLVGPIPEDCRVFRHCKEDLCVNPAHVYLVKNKSKTV